MDNSNGTSEGFARWVGMSVAAAFFASMDRCSCVNLATFESDDEDCEEVEGRPIMFTNSQRSCSISSTTTTTPKSTTVDKLPV
ncbi:hypothetical protein LIER_12358 [Lithospermum erythrorhizon]|uniref:Secreted protein n=1 Tax=Lithospermum erythrorhizon TaxID=34254 RepID=A0AAV3PUG5_LITER